MKSLSALVVLVLAVSLAAQEREPQQPRFRAGANLVRVDAYVTAGGQSVADLTQADFEVLEDGVPQRIESFEVVRPRGPAPEAGRVEPNTVTAANAMAADPTTRLFVLFLDVWHVGLGGSYRAQNPLTNLLNRAIGQDDLIGVMTPEMSARNLTFARRTTTIEGFLHDNWYWGERQRLVSSDPREEEIKLCYPDVGTTAGLAEDVIDRRRERKTLDSIADLIVHLEGLRDERKFVFLLSEGWRLPRRDDNLARVTDNRIPSVDPIGVSPGGRVTQRPQAGRDSGVDSCDRERMRLAAEDFDQDFRSLLQRANRANVSFYTVDPRGLTVFDEDLSSRRATDIVGDRERLTRRQDSLRELAANTDGLAFVNMNDMTAAVNRMMQDVGVYYLLGYYSTNTRLDGKFRKLTVRVKRPGAQVRARPCYLAPTEADAAAARVDRLMNGAAPGHTDTPPELRKALETLASVRGSVPLRLRAAAAPGQIWITAELEATTLKQPEWQQGGRLRLMLEHERGAAPPLERTLTLQPGQRTISLVEKGADGLPAGRYVIRLALTPEGGTLPLQTTTDVIVPDNDALLGVNGLALRRGPATGLQYQTTADARYERTERIRFEVPRLAADATVSARLLNRNAQPLQIPVTLSERDDATSNVKIVVADLTLAALAQGEYILEIAAEKNGKTERANYPFRIVP